MISNQNRQQVSGHKRHQIASAVLAMVMMASPMLANAQEISCKRGAAAVGARNVAVLETAERQQKAVDAVQFEIKSVSQVCNDMIKLIPHDVSSQMGRVAGIAPGVTGYIQKQTTRYVSKMCRKQLNAVQDTMLDARNSALGKIAESVGMNPRDLRKLAGEFIKDGTVSEKTIARTISNNDNIGRDIQQDVRKILEEGQKDFEIWNKSDPTIGPDGRPLTKTEQIGNQIVIRTQTYQSPQSISPPSRVAPKAPPPSSSQAQQPAPSGIIDRLKGLF